MPYYSRIGFIRMKTWIESEPEFVSIIYFVMIPTKSILFGTGGKLFKFELLIKRSNLNLILPCYFNVRTNFKIKTNYKQN